jgi:RNA polymerase sigma-70 factor (ECF subfamily)
MESIPSESKTTAAPLLKWRGCQEPRSLEAEEFLIHSALQGHDGAFWELIRPHLSFLTRFARTRLRSDQEAEDVVQQALLRALGHLRQFRGEARFRTWLISITCNEVSQWRRDQARAAILPLEEGWAANVRDSASAPDIKLQRRQEVQRLRQALTRLPEKYRHMIQLRDLHELSIAEIARSLSLTPAAVKTRHHRARKMLVRSFARVKLAA